MADRTTKSISPFAVVRRLWSLVPVGGSLPEDVWRTRHRFLLGLTWFHAVVIALIGPVLGYSWELSLEALFNDGTVIHTVGEGLIVAFFTATACWRKAGRTFQATAIGFGLMSSSAILVHLSGGYIEIHFHFFVMIIFLALYQDWVPFGAAILYVAIHHGVVGVLWPEEVYNHSAALNAPWTWAGIHAFFVLWASVGSIIAWRFNEKAFAQTKLILDSAGEGICGLDREGKITFINNAAAKMLSLDARDVVGNPMDRVLTHTNGDGTHFPAGLSPILAPLEDGTAHQASGEIFRRQDGTSFPVDYASTPIIERGELTGLVINFTDVTERKRAEKKLQGLYTVTNAVSRSLDIEVLMQAALRTTIDVLGVDAGRLYVFDGKINALRLAAHWGVPEDQLSGIGHYAPGEGVIGRIFVENKPLVFADVETDPNYQAMARGKLAQRGGYRSVAGLPITIKDRPVGVIYLYGKTVREFTAQDIELLSSIGSQIGVAIENARLFQETEQRARQQEALNAIATATTRSLDLKELFEIALDKTVEVTGRDRVNVRLKDPLTGKVSIVAYRGFSEEEIEDLRRRTPHPMSEQVFASGNPLIVNVDSVRDHNSLALLAQTRSVAWIPIKTGTRVVGVLGISDNQSKPFLPSEVDLLQAIGNVIGVAIENARLFDETKRNLERVRALREIDQAITSTLDLRTVLGVLLEKIDLVLPYSATTVRLLNKESGAIEPVACRNLDEKEWKAERWRGGRGIPNVVLETKAPVTISNVHSDPQNRDQEFFRKHGLVSYLGVPLIAKGEILGVISFYTKEEHEFNKEEIEFLSTLAGQAAIAIQNSQLYEEMIKLAADLSRANKVKDEFLSVMSHELRTPLNVVMGYSGMIKDGLLGEINPEQQKALDKVISRTRDQLAMISSILQAVQVEAATVKVQRHEVSLKDFLKDLESGYMIPLGKELSLVWDYPADFPVLETDGEKLKHVLQNLVNNAIKFTDRGTVTISARCLDGAGARGVRSHDAASNSRNGFVQFKVTDTGAGIPQDNLSLIFERFHQVDSSETRSYGGIGIGLYIVKKFTELLGGEVAVESEPGKGSTFTVTIPCDNVPFAAERQKNMAVSS